jgi:magnesium-protoporphyrin O-methyltransferase
MSCCCPHCLDAEDFFSDRTARRELRRYRRKGPVATTRLLMDAVRAANVEAGTLLDVGGGVGAIQHELLDNGVARATQVDASRAYLAASREEAERRGHADRVDHIHGDFVELADEIPPADIVTLDRVICCYPYMERLVEASVGRARHVYALVFPRERWVTRTLLALGNLYFRIRRSAFRTYIHPEAAVDAVVRRHGFRQATEDRTFIWRVVTWVRTEVR